MKTETLKKIIEEISSKMDSTKPDIEAKNLESIEIKDIGRKDILNVLNGCRRLCRLNSELEKNLKEHNTESICCKLIAKELDSAVAIVTRYLSKEDFEVAYNSDEQEEEEGELEPDLMLEALYTAAEKKYAELYMKYIALREINDPYLRATKFVQKTEVTNFQDMFGNLDYLGYEHNKSILSPAAYLFDLLRITHKHITSINQAPTGCSLQERRPDLFSLPLDAKHTEKKMPYIKVVNNILRKHLDNKANTEEEVFNKLTSPNTEPPTWFNLFNPSIDLQKEKISAYLKHHELSQQDFCNIFNESNLEFNLGQGYLGLSNLEKKLLSANKFNSIEELTSFSFVKKDNSYDISVHDLCNFLGIKRKELVQLLFPHAITKNKIIGHKNLKKEGNKFVNSINESTSPKNIIRLFLNGGKRREEVINLTIENLRKLGVFLLFSKKLNIPYDVLDNILCLCDKEVNNKIKILAKIKYLNDKNNIFSKICASWENAAKLTVNKCLAKITNYIEENKLTQKDINQKTLSRQGGIFEGSVIYILTQILGFDPQYAKKWYLFFMCKPDKQDISETMKVENKNWGEFLQASFKLSQTARFYNIPIWDLIRLIGLECTKNPEKYAEENLYALVVKQLVSGKLLVILDNIVHLNSIKNNITDAKLKLSWLEYIVYGEYSDKKEEKVLMEKIQKTIGEYISDCKHGCSDFELNSKPDKDDNDVLFSKLCNHLSELLTINRTTMQWLLNNKLLFGQKLYAKLKVLLKKIIKDQKAENQQELKLILMNLHRLSSLIKHFELEIKDEKNVKEGENDQNENLSGHEILLNNLFHKYADINNICTLENIKSLLKFKQIQKILKDNDGDFYKYFSLHNNDKYEKAFFKKIGFVSREVYRQFMKVIKSENDNEKNFSEKIDLIKKITGGYAIFKKLGYDIHIMEQLCKATEASLKNSEYDYSPVLIEAITEKLNTKQYDDASRELETLKKRVLTKYVIRKFMLDSVLQGNFPIKTLEDMSTYLLIDVEMSKCDTTTPIAQAIPSVQLYLQRCHLGVEKGITNITIPEEWRSWLSNYRVWEANRKLLLYPENFIQPDLRIQQSVEFKKFTQQIMQNSITPTNVKASFRQYFKELSNVATLVHCEACIGRFTSDDGSSIYRLYLFAHTKESPRDFYFRIAESRENLSKSDLNKIKDKIEWGYWQKIDAKINAKYISPVYDYDRLFIFWVENSVKHTPKLQKGEDQGKIFYLKYTIKYTYLDLDRKWCCPQTLIKNTTGIMEQTNKATDIDKVIQGDFNSVKFSDEASKTKQGKELYYNKLRVYGSLCIPHSANHNNILISYGDLSDENKTYSKSFSFTKNGIINDISFVKSEDELSDQPDLVKSCGGANLPSVDLFHYPKSNLYLVRKENKSVLESRGKHRSSLSLNPIIIEDLSRNLLLGTEKELFANYAVTKNTNSNKVTTDDFKNAFGLYFWEVFFHAPFYIATVLNGQQRFETARNWFHYIYNPSIANNRTPGFIFPPLKELECESIFKLLTDKNVLKIYRTEAHDIHQIAMFRPIVYKKVIMMHYIKNLIDWGDCLFDRCTRESIAQATNLYFMAHELLGKRPVEVGTAKEDSAMTFLAYLNGKWKTVKGEILLQLENKCKTMVDYSAQSGSFPYNNLNSYFSIPYNKEFIEYWDKIEDRLFKTRHCMTMQGVRKTLDLFAPEIDPHQLVSLGASSGGNIIKRIFANRELPVYRFFYLLGIAKDFANQLSRDIGLLLSIFEKIDERDLTKMNLTFQAGMQKQSELIYRHRINSAEIRKEILNENLEAARKRRGYYVKLINEPLNAFEITHEIFTAKACTLNTMSSIIGGGVSALCLVPQVGSPFAITFGGIQLARSLQAISSLYGIEANIASYSAEKALRQGNYKRRLDEWKHQKDLIESDIDSIKPQIKENELMQETAKQEYKNYQKEIEHSQQLLQYYEDRFTNIELYRWMQTQLMTIARQTYDMTLSMALSAQRSYHFELDEVTEEKSKKIFIGNNHWSMFYKGLCTGERLLSDLNRMEQAYIENNKRLYEMEKTISLKKRDQGEGALLKKLQAGDECTFTIDESMLVEDFGTGLCECRIKTVRVTISALVAPYQNLYFKLMQKSSRMISQADGKSHSLNSNKGQSIIVSTGINDAGLFNARDDARYLPFEGTGLLSEWELVPMGNKEKYGKIRDVLLRIQFTAKPSNAPEEIKEIKKTVK